jgi:hypothetical protein
MKIDWQDYEDGMMSPDERMEADRLLAESEEARAELEGLRAFRTAVRRACLAEPVPSARLRRSLSRSVGSRPSRRWAFPASLAAAACCAAAAWIALSPSQDQPAFSAASSPMVAQVAARSPVEAQGFLSERCGMAMPKVTLAGYGRLEGATAGRDWGCYDFQVQDRKVHIYVRRDDGRLSGRPSLVHNGMPMFEREGVGWNCSGWTYYVIGAPMPILREIAGRVCDETRPKENRL